MCLPLHCLEMWFLYVSWWPKSLLKRLSPQTLYARYSVPHIVGRGRLQYAIHQHNIEGSLWVPYYEKLSVLHAKMAYDFASSERPICLPAALLNIHLNGFFRFQRWCDGSLACILVIWILNYPNDEDDKSSDDTMWMQIEYIYMPQLMAYTFLLSQ